MKRVLLALLLICTSLVAFTAPASADARAGNTVLFLHGYIFNSLCPGGDISANYTEGAQVLRAVGWTGTVDHIGYYACDTGGSPIWKHGKANTYFPGGEFPWAFTGTSVGGGTNNSDIRHLAYQLAWYIYDAYSSKGKTVAVVGYSLGGLITAWMQYQIGVHNPLFPPYLYVQDVVTIAAPLAGVNDGYNNVTWCPSGTVCQQALPGSPFTTELQAKGLAGQATGGTDWTAIGGSTCDAIDNPHGTTLASGNTHKVWYYAAQPVCYSHTSYITDTSVALDEPLKYRNPGDADWTATTGAHALLAAAQAVLSPRS